MNCSIEGCERPVRTRGFCRIHYRRWLKYGDPLATAFVRGDPVARFWSHVDKAPSEHAGGWLWTGETENNGYGRIFADGKKQGAHRFAYELLIGPIPKGMTVDHVCHNIDDECPGGVCVHRRCLFPEHLALKPLKPNILAGKGLAAENAKKTHCKQGHPFDEANTYLAPSGRRVCRTCMSFWGRQNRARKRAG